MGTALESTLIVAQHIPLTHLPYWRARAPKGSDVLQVFVFALHPEPPQSSLRVIDHVQESDKRIAFHRQGQHHWFRSEPSLRDMAPGRCGRADDGY